MGLKSLKEEHGFTLVEVMAALTVLLIVVMTFSSIINSGYKLSRDNKIENTALALAQEKMEEIKAAWPSNLTDLTPGGSKVTQDVEEVNGNDVVNRVTRNGLTFERVIIPENVYEVNNPPNTWIPSYIGEPPPDGTAKHYLLKVVVKVNWLENKRPHSVALVTYLTGR